jgi:hypothetical protein
MHHDARCRCARCEVARARRRGIGEGRDGFVGILWFAGIVGVVTLIWAIATVLAP